MGSMLKEKISCMHHVDARSSIKEKMESYQIINHTTDKLFSLNKSDLTFINPFVYIHLSHVKITLLPLTYINNRTQFYLVKENLKLECIYITHIYIYIIYRVKDRDIERERERMGKGRAPCCDKTKVKRGPWSPEEDLKLISFIQKFGHENWRSLPKQSGKLFCCCFAFILMDHDQSKGSLIALFFLFDSEKVC